MPEEYTPEALGLEPETALEPVDPDEEFAISFTLDELGDLIYVAELGSVGLGNEPQVLTDIRGIFEELCGTSET